LCEILKLLRRC